MIYQIFSNNLQSKPEATAIVTSEGKTYTYSTADRRVNQWANYLIEQGIKTGDRVGVLLDNEDEHIFILLALDRINAPYVPFDTDIPKRQLTLDITALQLKKFIVEEKRSANFDISKDIELKLSCAELAKIDAQNNQPPSRSYNTNAFDKVTYIVSSSGSTGDKKWIPILGAGLLYWADVEKKLFAASPIDKVLVTRSPAYDARISEYVRTFAAGGELHFLTRTQRKDFPSILAACEKSSISCLLLIASQLGSNSEDIVSKLKTYGVKHLLVTGDACTLHLKELCERYDINLWNCYGPTEATFGISLLRVNGLHTQNVSGETVVPIGKPYGQEVRYHIIDGKLYIESPYLTPGYLKIEDNDTNFKWIETANSEKIRLFDTGDAFYEKDEFLFYEGRFSVDGHCKINGVKVTPFYIEKCIHDYNQESGKDSVQAAVVIKKLLGKNKPFAYLVTNPDFNETAFVAYLMTKLKKEEFPIPIIINSFPLLTPSQKIDRRQLIALQDDPDTFYFSKGKRYRAKFSNDGKGLDDSKLAEIHLKLADDDYLKSVSSEDFGKLIDEAVLCANQIDQQNHNQQENSKEKEARVVALLEIAYNKLVAIYPILDFLSQHACESSEMLALPPHILSTAAQLLHYFGKALRYRYTEKEMKPRMAMFEASIVMINFLESHVQEETRKTDDPNYFKSRMLTYHLPIIYNLRQMGQFSLAIEKCQQQLALAKESEDVFHVVQALVQLSESYLLDGQIDLAFEQAHEAYHLIDNPSSKHSILFFNAQTMLMKCADNKQDKVLATQLARAIVALECTDGIALKAHHLTAARKILGLEDINYHLAVKKIWCELLQQDNLPVDAEFMFLGGDSSMAMEMVGNINAQLDSSYNYLSFLSLVTHTINNIADSIIDKKIHSSEQAFIHPLVHAGAEKGNIFFLPSLLGEGYFTYRHLAKRVAQKFDSNIYGLSDPGIADESLLPESMEQAVSRYIRAIKNVQPKGPYTLLGFSYGSTLAYEVAKQLHLQGDAISELYLLDGFPPHLYQALSSKAHADLLQSLVNFIVTILNTHYAEKLEPLKFRHFKKLTKLEQIEMSFNALIEKVANPASKNLLNIAKRHLTFLLSAKEPQQKLPIWPTFYLTNRNQQYLQVINQFPGLSKDSADYQYFFWTRYFEHMTRCGIELEGEHLSIVDARPDIYKQTPDCFWERAHDPLFNLKVDHYGPHNAYRLEPLDATHHQLSLFFLNRRFIHHYYREMEKMGLSPRVAFHDKYLKKYEQGDLIYTSQANLFCSIPNDKIEQVNAFMAKSQVTAKPRKPPIAVKPLAKEKLQAPSMQKQSGNIDLHVLWNRRDFLTLSFKYHSIPIEIITSLFQQLKFFPVAVSQDQGNILYKYEFVLVGCTFYQAMASVEGVLADFISVLQTHISEELPQVEHPSFVPA